ncbi:MAG TPA: efflux RND transporter periplasmic adaptor subunit [Noviherbaspirillum sp.]|nr:efflux RND transporter periplasmic adaptor subunit [Noviherbaspirillum sp.]
MRAKWIFLVAFIAATALTNPAVAGPGHDHGDEAPAANSNGPTRLPDGSVFLPKPTQRQLGVRTIVAETGELPRAYELAGKVVMDPNAGGKVQPTVAGRLVPGPNGLPSFGQPVRKGEVLAYVIPASGAIERSNQAAQLSELRSAKAVAERRLARLKELSDTVPRKEIEAAESEAQALGKQIAALGKGLSEREALTAPVAGVIASANAAAGQVVEPRELLFEIVDPARLRIEALAYDPEQVTDVAGATVAIGGARVPLEFVGAARLLRQQALPMMFRGENQALSKLAVGQPVRVYVQTASTVKGLRVPAAALMKNPANQTIIWVKAAPERFEPRVVTAEPLDGASVAVTSGLQPGDRVATTGATLINQVR